MKLYNVGYLENKDINENGRILMNKITSKNNSFGFKKNKHKKILVMVQANFCGHCTNAKPDFQKLAYKDNDVFCATIHGDSDNSSEKHLTDRIRKIYPDFRGFPHYALHDENGKRIRQNIKHGRTYEDLKKFTS